MEDFIHVGLRNVCIYIVAYRCRQGSQPCGDKYTGRVHNFVLTFKDLSTSNDDTSKVLPDVLKNRENRENNEIVMYSSNIIPEFIHKI